MRLFVAVDIDAASRAAIAALQRTTRDTDRDRQRGTLRWVKPEHLHLTLVFLGNVDDAYAPAVIEAYAQPVPTAPFDLVFRGLGAFPQRGAPRALWVGVDEGANEVVAVQQVMAERAQGLRIPIDARPFSPHLTLARWKESRPSDRRLLDNADDKPIARVPVSRATLYQSRLSSAGPTYTALAHATLTAPR